MADPINYTGESTGDILNCTCCGGGVPNTPEGNVSFSDNPYPHDKGFGMCRECGGEDAPLPKDATQSQIEKKMGWAMTTFVTTRFDIVRSRINAENQAKWDNMSYIKRVNVVLGLVRKGVII